MCGTLPFTVRLLPDLPAKPDLGSPPAALVYNRSGREKSGRKNPRILSDNQLIEPVGSGLFKCRTLPIFMRTMIGDFCTWTAGRIRRLGYTQKCATWYSRFFFVSMLSVCAAAGALAVPSEGMQGSITGSGKSRGGARTGMISPGLSYQRRY